MFPNLKKRFTALTFTHTLTDVVAVLSIFVFGFFLIGAYLNFNYLRTDYQDWFYHAFRIESIARYGLVSWDWVWSNGLNYWQAYQYLPHILTLGIGLLLKLQLAKAMLVVVVFNFIVIRLFTYIALRLLKITPLVAGFVTLSSYAFAQQWITIKDFSIFVFLFIIPIFAFWWTKAFTHRNLFYILMAVAGASWILHPILGYTLTGLVCFAVLFNLSKIKPIQLVILAGILIASSASFTIPFFRSGYFFSNPLLASAQFQREILQASHFGLSNIFLALLGLSWVVTFLQTGRLARWTKILLLYVSVMMMGIVVAQAGYFPASLNQLQLPRAITLIGFLLPFIFAPVIQTLLQVLRSHILWGALAVLLAINLTNSVAIATQYSADVVNQVGNPVAEYFKDKPLPTGSVYYENVAEATYFAPVGLRYPTSYNEHLEPHPLGQRLRKLLKNDSIYTGINQKQLELLGAYADVLGIEYLFVPTTSPLVRQLTAENNDKAQFKVESVLQPTAIPVAVLRNTHPIHQAYLIDHKAAESIIHFQQLPKPTLLADSYQEWDQEILQELQIKQAGIAIPVSINYLAPEKLQLQWPANQKLDQKDLVIFQSYDPGWKAENNSAVELKPTSLRMIYISNAAQVKNNQLVLVHHWPDWYWPVQTLGIITVVVTFAGLGIHSYTQKRKANA